MPIYFSLFDGALPLAPESIGHHWDQEDISRPQGYPFYHWLQTESGAGRVRIRDEDVLLGEGEGIFIAPFIPHAYTRAAQHWTTSFLTLGGALESSISKIVGDQPYLLVGAQGAAQHRAWIDQTIDAHRKKEIDSTALSCGCYAFLLRLSRRDAESDVTKQLLYQSYVLPTIADIETRYQEPITARDLAAARYVSQQYLTRLFNRYLGCSMYAYLTNYRMNKAKEWLANKSGLEVEQIAYRVGYTDASHFIAMFKQKTGYTPSAFRRLHTGG